VHLKSPSRARALSSEVVNGKVQQFTAEIETGHAKQVIVACCSLMHAIEHVSDLATTPRAK
jgi:hypothetical protein